MVLPAALVLLIDGCGDLLAHFSDFAIEQTIFAAGHGDPFALHAAIAFKPAGVEGAGGQGGFDRAARFGVVAAVGEFAGGGQGVDVGERGGQGIVGFAEGQAAEAGRVDDQAAHGRQGGTHEVAEGGAMAAFVVKVAHFHHVLHVGLSQVINQGAFAHAGGAQDNRGDAGAQVVADGIHALAGNDADGMNVLGAQEGLGFADKRRGVGAAIGFGQEDHGLDVRVARHGQVAFEAAEGEVVVERSAQEGQVDVHGEDLGVPTSATAFAFALEAACDDGAAREDAGNLDGSGVFGGVLNAAEDDPVADGGVVGADGAVVAHFAGDFGPDILHAQCRRADQVGFLMFLHDACQLVQGFARRQQGVEVVVPAVFQKVAHGGIVPEMTRDESLPPPRLVPYHPWGGIVLSYRR